MENINDILNTTLGQWIHYLESKKSDKPVDLNKVKSIYNKYAPRYNVSKNIADANKKMMQEIYSNKQNLNNIINNISNLKDNIALQNKEFINNLSLGNSGANIPAENKANLFINKRAIKNIIPRAGSKAGLPFTKVLGPIGTAGTAIPIYKDIMFPVANDMYKAIKGDENSKILKFFMDLANAKSNVNTNASNASEEGLESLPELDNISNSDLISNSNRKNSRRQTKDISNAVNNQILNESLVEGSTTRVPSEDDINILNDYILRLQNIREPYLDSLENYISNYYKNLDKARRADLYFYGANLAKGLNPKAGEKFNPLQSQADIINMLKLISDAKAGDLNAINELQGNMAIAKTIDLPEQAAFANKNLLSALSYDRKYNTEMEKARLVDAYRRYNTDVGYRKAIDAQNLRNAGNANTALIYMGLNEEPAVGLAQGGIPVQQQSYSPMKNKFDKYEGK